MGEEEVQPNSLLDETQAPTAPVTPKKAVKVKAKKDKETPEKKTREKKLKKSVPKLTAADRKDLMKKEISVEQVVELSKAGLKRWPITEKVYDRVFDHADRSTWTFYQKVGAIQNANNVDNIAPISFPCLSYFVVVS